MARYFKCDDAFLSYQLTTKKVCIGLIDELFCSKKNMIFINLVCILTAFTQHVRANQSVVVHTQYGNILGYQTDLARVFYGIPFAQPPTDTLR